MLHCGGLRRAVPLMAEPSPELLREAGAGRPVLIAGPTASGKSALALAIAEHIGGVVVNADALQVHDCWHVLTARPGEADLARAPHALYGHVPAERRHSAGDWLGEVRTLLGGERPPVIVGGTGLYLSLLTEGLADIPAIPDEVRTASAQRLADAGLTALVEDLSRDDPETLARIDTANPMRVQRAWEVLRATGRGLSAWHRSPTRPLLPLAHSLPLLVTCPRERLAERIERRFDWMLASGALEEARALLPRWRPDLPAARAIGARELVAHLKGEMSLAEARAAAIVATRQYAKRQRTWFRARMKDWRMITSG